MKRLHDKYGRGSAAVNGAEFVDLEPGDTFSGLETRLRASKDCVYKNATLRVSASVGSMRNANELAKHLGRGEDEEAHKFAAKNVGALFARAGVGIRHLDKKAVIGARWIVTYVRVFSWFVFAGKRKLATITLKENKGLNNFYSVEAVEINEDADSERTPHGAMPEDLNSAPFQNLASQLASRIAYYVGDVNRTRPAFLARSEAFRVETAAELIMGMADSFGGKDDGKELSDLLTIVIPVKNEEKNLPACLENVREFRHVVVVDSGSTDRTKEIFDGLRSNVSRPKVGWDWLDFKWNGKFPKKRNWALRNYKFKTPWALFLDADERVTEAWKKEAEEVLSAPRGERSKIAEDRASGTVGTDRYDVIKCYYDNWFMGKMLRHGDCMQKTAMVRVGAAEYEKIDEDHWSSLDMEIHEHLQSKVSGDKSQVSGREGEIRARLEHHDKRSFESHVAKHREYAKWEVNRYRQLMAHPERWEALTPRQKVKYRNLTKWWLAPAYFAVCYIRKLGFLDGYAGLRFALFKAWYFSLIRKQLRDEQCS